MSPEHAQLLDAFVEEESARGRRPRGVAGVVQRLPWFIDFMEARGASVTATTLEDARAYQGSLVVGCRQDGAPYRKRTVASYVSAAAAFSAWLARSHRSLDDPFPSLSRVRTERTIPAHIPDEAGLARLLGQLARWDAAADCKAMTRRYLAHLAAETQYASGLRIAELASLTVEDVDIDRALLYVRDGKQGSHRVAFLTEYACELLEAYGGSVRSRLVNGKRHASTLFLLGRDRLAHIVNGELAAARAELAATATDADMALRCTSHGLRHALGYHLLRAGCPLRYIQTILGHARIRNTELYTKVDAADVKAVFDACHPRMHA